MGILSQLDAGISCPTAQKRQFIEQDAHFFLLSAHQNVSDGRCYVQSGCYVPCHGSSCVQARGLGAGEYHGTSLGLSHTHCRGERKRSGCLFDPAFSTPVHILTWSQKTSTKAVFKLWGKCADLRFMQCHRMGDFPGRKELYKQGDGKVGLLPTDDWPAPQSILGLSQ